MTLHLNKLEPHSLKATNLCQSLSSFEQGDGKEKSLETEGQTNHGHQAIRIAHLSVML